MSKLLKALEKARDKKDQEPSVREKKQFPDKLANAYEKAVRGQGDAPAVGLVYAQKGLRDNWMKSGYTRTQILKPNDRLLESNLVMTHLKDPLIKDYYDILRTQVLQRTKTNGWNSLMVTSAYPGEGKTLTSINLALAIARHFQQTALLVGANFRTPKICTYFGLEENRTGLSDYLANGARLQDILFNPGIDKMVVLPTGQKIASTDILGSPKMKDLVQELKTRYPERYVIYDCPHVLDMPDTLVFSSYVDAVLMVVQAGKTPRQGIQDAVRTLEEQGVNVIGMVLNKAGHS